MSLSGLVLADRTTINFFPEQQFKISSLSYLGVGRSNAFVTFIANDTPLTAEPTDEVNFGLGRNGDDIYLLNSDRAQIDHVVWDNRQVTDVSEGRIPDGGTTISPLPTRTLGRANIGLISNALINEILTHTDDDVGTEDAIELYNPTDTPANIGGFYLSERRRDVLGNLETLNLRKYRIPDNTIIPARGFKVFYEQVGKAAVVPRPGFNTSGDGDDPDFTYNSARGGIAYLTEFDAGGNPVSLTLQEFAPAANGVSFGRYTTSDGRVEFTAMNRRTFGVDNPTTVAQFRQGRGLANSPPKVGPVVINEIMYHPPDIIVPGVSTNDNELDEYIELRNITAAPVRLYDPLNTRNRWWLSNGVDYAFPANVTIAASAYFLVVGFDPATNTAQLAAFRAKHNLPTSVRIFGPWRGQLNNNNDTLEFV